MTDYSSVSRDECDRIQELREKGLTHREIAAQVDRRRSTIRLHCTEECQHYDGLDISIDEIQSLMIDLAESIGRVPLGHDWDMCETAPCDQETVRKIAGDNEQDWTTVLEECDLPTVANNSPRAIRRHKYERHHLTGCEEGES